MDDDGLRYTVYSLPAIPGQHHIIQYKDLRLQATQTDPQYFSSTHKAERTLSYKQWRARLQSRDKKTIIAAVTFQSLERLSWQHKWVGTVTIVGPRVLHKFGFVPPRSVRVPGGIYYLFVGIWVQPAHRRKGLGQKMISAGIEWIQQVADDADVSGEDEKKKKRTLLLHVSRQSKPAIGLYASMGFRPIESDKGAKDENIWMGMSL